LKRYTKVALLPNSLRKATLKIYELKLKLKWLYKM